MPDDDYTFTLTLITILSHEGDTLKLFPTSITSCLLKHISFII